MESYALVIILMVVLWLVQFVMSFFQMNRFYKRQSQLRRDGLLATGMDGSRWSGRTYGVMTIDKNSVINHAESLSGITVFATLKPVPQLVGMRLDEIAAENEPPQGVSKRKWAAFCAAAQMLRDHLQKKHATSEPIELSNGKPPALSEEVIAAG